MACMSPSARGCCADTRAIASAAKLAAVMPADTPTFSPAALARCLPFAVFMALLALRGYLPADLGIDARWIYGAKTVIVGGLLAWFWREYGELARQNLPDARETGLAV